MYRFGGGDDEPVIIADPYLVFEQFMAKAAGRDYRMYLAAYDALERSGVATNLGVPDDAGRLMEDLRFVLRHHPDLLASAEAAWGDDAPRPDGRMREGAVRRGACLLLACAFAAVAVVVALVSRLYA